jgi:L-malate glycosyltransferase
MPTNLHSPRRGISTMRKRRSPADHATSSWRADSRAVPAGARPAQLLHGHEEREVIPMARIGVLHVIDCLDVGGTERQMIELMRGLDRQRFRTLVACFKPGGELTPRLRALGIEPIAFPLRGSLAQANTAYQVARMALLCRREQVHIVHAHAFYSNLIGVAAARLAGARSIAGRRDLAHWLSPMQRRALGVICRLADVVVANAEAVAEQTTRELGVDAARLQVVPNGIDVAEFDRQACAVPEPALPRTTPTVARIAAVASMSLPDKGHGDLLDAAARLKQRGVRAHWLLVSDGVLRGELEARARRLGLGDDVSFLGRRADIPAVLARVDLVVHPSWAEGFPNVVLEGMCAARPVVATRVGGTPEVVVDGETGLLVERQRPAALADAIERLLAAPDVARRMGRRGRRRVERVYSLRTMCATVEALYERLTGGAPAHAGQARHPAAA